MVISEIVFHSCSLAWVYGNHLSVTWDEHKRIFSEVLSQRVKLRFKFVYKLIWSSWSLLYVDVVYGEIALFFGIDVCFWHCKRYVSVCLLVDTQSVTYCVCEYLVAVTGQKCTTVSAYCFLGFLYTYVGKNLICMNLCACPSL
jgi:hypothetical protein